MESGAQSYPPPNTRWWREVELPHEHRDGTGSYPLTAVWDPELEQNRSVITLWHGNQDEELLWEELVHDVDLQSPGPAETNLRKAGTMKVGMPGHPGASNKGAEEQPVFKVGYLGSSDVAQIFEKESWELISAALEKIHANDVANGMTALPQGSSYYQSTPERNEYKMMENHEHRFRSSPKTNPSPVRDSPVPHCSTQSPDDEKTRRYINRLEEAVRQSLALKKDQQESSRQLSPLSPRHKNSAFELWKERAVSFLKISEETRQKYEQIKRRRAGLPNDRQLFSYILDTMKNLGLLAMDIVRNGFLFCYLLGCMMCRLAVEAYRAPRFVKAMLALGFIIAVLGAVYLSSMQHELMYNGFEFDM